jgi:hypothetical protein
MNQQQQQNLVNNKYQRIQAQQQQVIPVNMYQPQQQVYQQQNDLVARTWRELNRNKIFYRPY